jgi:hypothetical protein
MSRINRMLRPLKEERKAIPSKVFFNHFFAVSYFLSSDQNRFNLKATPFYNQIAIKNPDFSVESVKKLLWNSWSTEYAFRIGELLDNREYYKYSLHWNFPQAYYSAYLAMTAFHETQGIANEQHEKSIRIFGNSIKDGHYPDAISYYVSGSKDEFEYFGLKAFKGFEDGFSSLSNIECLVDAEQQIATFLKTTRIQNADEKKRRAKNQNDKRFHTSKGTFKKSFQKQDWDLIFTTIPVTSIFNLLYRLRIKANYKDIETFINANIDFRKFHENLGQLIYYLNFVHEAYVVKAIGIKAYDQILRDFPGHSNRSSALERFEKNILPLWGN